MMPQDDKTRETLAAILDDAAAEREWARIESLTPEQLDAELRAAGIDPVAAVARIRAKVDELLRKSKEDIPITLHWHCGCFVGPCKWHGTEDYEPDERDTDFTTEDSMEMWVEKQCSAECPRCGAELTQKYDKPEMTVNQILPQ